MSYPNRPPPGGPSYYRQAGYEANSSAFNSTSYPSTTSFDPSAAYGQPQNQQGGVGRRQTVRGAQRGTIRDAQANPHQSTSGGGGGGGAVQRGLTRGKTLTRPDRFVAPAPLITPAGLGKGGKQGGNVQTKLVGGVPTLVTQEPWYDPWSLFVEVSTFWAPRALLRGMGMTDPTKQRAWKEKCALCEVAMFLMGVVGFITIGLNRVLCPTSGPRSADAFITVGKTAGYVGVEGWSMQVNSITPTSLSTPAASYGGTDETGLFDRSTYTFSGCDGFSNAWATANLCNTATSTGNSTTCTLKAPTATYLASLGLTNSTKQVGYDWDQLSNFTNFIVIDGNVLNLTPYLKAYPTALKNDTVDAAIRFMLDDTASGSTKDATRIFYNTDDLKTAASCLTQRYYAGHIDKVTPGCFAANLFLYVSLILIMGIVLARFAMACVFSWYLAARMVRKPSNLKRNVVSPAVLPEGANIDVNNTTGAAPWTESHIKRQQTMRLQKKGGAAGGRKGRGGGGDLEKRLPSAAMGKDEEPLPVSTDGMISAASIGAELFTVCLVTCYSEGHDGIKTTLDSIAATSYSDARKLIFVVCDGMITGSGEKLSTPDIVVGMIEREARFGDPQPMSYVAVADGPKAHNQALVYAGHYTSVPGHRTPIVVVVKCGPPSEASENKPGNRGKRDSQMILMNFFSRVTYNDRMCPLDYDLFRKTQSLMGVTADFFELCLMVDADTMCYPEALGYLVRSMQNDNMIMGICGETRIANKRQSWVTMIQVFEYFISHHLAKSFESVFGGVTCLPGCFSMYRIKARKQDDGDWFPVLVQPTIVSEYSQSVVTTLHQKNLLLLGEDRFLTTLLLRNFPNRKMMFCPYARCRTVVPDTFSILLSQRRRWINSTIHNLMELILVRNLCGTFCFSMQFITFIDLVGTVVLPIAICLTYSLIINYIFTPPTGFSDAIPLVLLAGVLGLPAILIVLTTFKIVYVGWMLIYLIALPIWNFVLPIYAFSKFDDFSWGETRKVAGETKGADDHGGAGGVSGASAVPLRRWDDWERSRLRKLKREEKRKREFERQFGSRAVHGTTSNGGSTYGGDSETASSYGGGDEDRWGLQIGAYNEDASTVANAPPPVGLYSVDEWEEEDDSETINQHDLVNVLDQGWDDNSPIPSPSPSYSRQMPGPPLGVGGVGGGSGYSTPTEQQQYYGRDGGLGAQPYPHSQYPQQQQQQPPPRLYSLSDAPAMNRSASSQSASQRVPLTASSASLASSGEAVTPSGSGEGNPFSDPLAASASSSGIDHNNGWGTGGGHARQRSLTSSPEVVNRTGGGGTGSYGPLGGSNTPSPTRERGGYDFGDAGGRRLL